MAKTCPREVKVKVLLNAETDGSCLLSFRQNSVVPAAGFTARATGSDFLDYLKNSGPDG